MKVAVLIDTWFPFVGGGQINAYEISSQLAKNGVKIDIITRNSGKDSHHIANNLKIIKLGSKSDPADFFSKFAFLFRSFFYIYRNNYNLIHAHAFLPGITARLISVFIGVPSILTVHGTSIGSNLNNRFSEFLEKLILTKIKYNAQITVSRDFLNFVNVNKGPVYIPNAVNVDLYDLVSVKKKLKPTIIFVGRLHPQKNILTLIKAMTELKKTVPGARLLIIGSGKQRSVILKQINKNNLSKRVNLVGEVAGKDLIKYYKSSHLLVLPSIYEGQPLAVLEAWAAKIPVIASRSGDCRFLIKDGINGYLIDNPLDYQKLAQKIQTALTGRKLNKMGINGYNFIKKNYSWGKSAKLTQEVYEKAAKAAN